MKIRFGMALIAAAAISMCVSDMALAQPGAGGRFGRGMGGTDSASGLLQNEKIREELEIVDDQYEEFRSLRDEMAQEMRNMFSGLRDLDPEERRERFQELRSEMDERRKELDEQVMDLLLPHQQKRLQQLTIQSQLRRSGGNLGFMSNDKVVEKLGITKEQQEELKKRAEKVRKELEEKIAKARKAAEEDLLSVLSSEQREQFLTMIGERFEFQNERGRRGERGERGGRGDRGGERGRRGAGSRPGSDF